MRHSTHLALTPSERQQPLQEQPQKHHAGLSLESQRQDHPALICATVFTRFYTTAESFVSAWAHAQFPVKVR